MPEVGAYEAKTHLSELLERVSEGERIVITKHGTPVAVLAPITGRGTRPVLEVISELRAFRRGNTGPSILCITGTRHHLL